jgi:hypothetical protein
MRPSRGSNTAFLKHFSSVERKIGASTAPASAAPMVTVRITTFGSNSSDSEGKYKIGITERESVISRAVGTKAAGVKPR